MVNRPDFEYPNYSMAVALFRKEKTRKKGAARLFRLLNIGSTNNRVRALSALLPHRNWLTKRQGLAFDILLQKPKISTLIPRAQGGNKA
jgi:hypothetical protein